MIIDALSAFPPRPQSFAAADETLVRLRGYREHFGGDAEFAQDRDGMDERLADVRAAAIAAAPSEENYLRTVLDGGITRAAVYTEKYETSLGVVTATNEEVCQFVARYPEQLFGVGGVDPWDFDAPQKVHHAVRELGMRGIIVSPFKQRLAPDDVRMARIYGACETLGVPILLHTGVNWWLENEYDVGHPRGIDRVASAFPNLKILCLHAGWPWVMDMMVVAWRHRNVYIEISAHRPKHFTVAESGWGPLLYYGGRMLSDRVVFASAWALLGMPIGDLIDEVRALPLSDKVLDQWLGGNAARLYGLE